MQQNNTGFTLIELLMSMAVLVCLLLFSTQFSESFYKKNQLEWLANEIKTAVYFSKMQSYSRNQTLSLMPLANTLNWSEGMKLVVDNPSHTYMSDSKIVYEWRWNVPNTTITWQGFQGKKFLLFSPDIKTSDLNGFFIISNKANQRKVILNRLGRARGDEQTNS